MRRQHRRTLVAAMTTALVLATGCSGGDGASSDGTGDGSAGEGQQSSSTGGSATDGSDAPVENSATVPPDEAVISKKFDVPATYEDRDVTIRFDLIELKRRGDLLQLVVHLVNTETDKSTDLRWQVGAGTFSGDVQREDLSGVGDFEGVVLTDVANKKRYLVAADSAGDCVCTGDLSGTFVGAGDTAVLTATYAAPPESVTKLDVHVPTIGLFRDVPVS